MAVNFQRQATRQLAPAYNQQIRARRAQIKPIQQKYNALIEGLGAQQQAANLNAFEDASSRGLLKSTIPVDAQQAIAQGVLQKRGEYAGQMAQDVGQIRSQIADIGVQRATSIADLVGALRDRALAERQFNQNKILADRDFNYQQELLNRGFF